MLPRAIHLHFEVRNLLLRVGINILIKQSNLLPPLVCSLHGNTLGPEGGIAIAEALKINKTVTTIK
jgi:hypothetical protein